MKKKNKFREIVLLWKDKRQYVKKSTFAAYDLLLKNTFFRLLAK